jgi:hypothetical protein
MICGKSFFPDYFYRRDTLYSITITVPKKLKSETSEKTFDVLKFIDLKKFIVVN